ncbi:MAG: nitronate monooxygenase [Candidatus Dormibacteraeota bacterium]|nr:nitronate monooxygenase [Candidatus Dormibacteraeota bacterium]
MGVGVSSWRLARAVATRGHLGVVSGVALDSVLVRRLQGGDADGVLRRAIAEFPIPEIAEDVLTRFLRVAGSGGRRYRLLPMQTHRSGAARNDVTVLGAFVEVTLAKEGHGNPVGINLLTKVQLPTLATLYGAMLAGVDYVLMGAGIPREIPGILDALAAGRPATLRLDVTGADRDAAPVLRLDPARYGTTPHLRRPEFLPIVSSHTLATMLARKSTGAVAGFIVEAPIAGGHNAPPRGTPTYDDDGQPIYGERDHVDLEVMRGLGLPFWLAGGMSTPEKVIEAEEHGAAGVQVGSLFAYCNESGIAPELRRAVIDQVCAGQVRVHTDPVASSTGYPFKVVTVPGTGSEHDVYQARTRICDLGYLREAYVDPKGGVGYRCSAEPVNVYVGKGGLLEDTIGRKCLCNGLTATIGLGQVQKGGAPEPPLVTSGDELTALRTLTGDDGHNYSASDVIDYLLPVRPAAASSAPGPSLPSTAQQRRR